MEKEIICIICPNSCRLKVNLENDFVAGNECKRGIVYGLMEAKEPKRVITSTVQIIGGIHSKLPVKTSMPILKNKNFQCMEIIKNIKVFAPIKCGDIILENICEENVDLIATRDMDRVNCTD